MIYRQLFSLRIMRELRSSFVICEFQNRKAATETQRSDAIERCLSDRVDQIRTVGITHNRLVEHTV